MEILSNKIHLEALAEVAEEYNLSKEDTQRIIKMYADYNFDTINSIDMKKDLRYQPTRALFPGVGAVFIHRLVMIENERIRGRVPKYIYEWTRKWFHNVTNPLNIRRIKSYIHELNIDKND